MLGRKASYEQDGKQEGSQQAEDGQCTAMTKGEGAFGQVHEVTNRHTAAQHALKIIRISRNAHHECAVLRKRPRTTSTRESMNIGKRM